MPAMHSLSHTPTQPRTCRRCAQPRAQPCARTRTTTTVFSLFFEDAAQRPCTHVVQSDSLQKDRPAHDQYQPAITNTSRPSWVDSQDNHLYPPPPFFHQNHQNTYNNLPPSNQLLFKIQIFLLRRAPQPSETCAVCSHHFTSAAAAPRPAPATLSVRTPADSLGARHHEGASPRPDAHRSPPSSQGTTGGRHGAHLLKVGRR